MRVGCTVRYCMYLVQKPVPVFDYLHSKNMSFCVQKGQHAENNHRTARVGRDLKDHESPTPLPHQGHQPPHLTSSFNQAAQGPIQSGLEHFQGRGIHNLSGQPVPVPHHSL